MKQFEIVVSPPTVTKLIDIFNGGADSIVIGNAEFGLRLPTTVDDIETIAEIIQLVHSLNKKCYIAINSIIHNHQIERLTAYMKAVIELAPDAIIFGDPAVYMISKELESSVPLFWSTETTGTNWFSAKIWFDKGIQRVILAKELTIDSINDMKNHVSGEIEIQAYGALCMFQSRRTLLQNYYNHDGTEEQLLEADEKLTLFDQERDNYYPIFEDMNGTHIMSAKDVCIIDELASLKNVDSLKLDGLFKTDEQMCVIIEAFAAARTLLNESLDAYRNERKTLFATIEAVQNNNRPMDKGFLYKPTIY